MDLLHFNGNNFILLPTVSRIFSVLQYICLCSELGLTAQTVLKLYYLRINPIELSFRPLCEFFDLNYYPKYICILYRQNNNKQLSESKYDPPKLFFSGKQIAFFFLEMQIRMAWYNGSLVCFFWHIVVRNNSETVSNGKLIFKSNKYWHVHYWHTRANSFTKVVYLEVEYIKIFGTNSSNLNTFVYFFSR